MKEVQITKAVRERYGSVARQGSSCCSISAKKGGSCCGAAPGPDDISKSVGYSDADIASVPEGANLGLGCGNPLALASLKKGETVLDLGSGGGFDCFLAAGQVGATGRVIGVDMTADMLDRARENAQKGGYKNVEFRLGEIENLPVADSMVDAIISNCVINLSQHKDRVFTEAFRVLKPGGRLMVSDMVLLSPLPEDIRESVEAYVGCIAGASLKDEYLAAIRGAGFQNVSVVAETALPVEMMTGDPTVQELLKKSDKSPEEWLKLAETVVSVKVSSVKPRNA
jgi:arsenite methyltransferase